MNKFKTYLVVSIIALTATAIACAIRATNNQCKCIKYKKFTEVTIYPDAKFDSRVDSICWISTNNNGDMVVKKFEEATPKTNP